MSPPPFLCHGTSTGYLDQILRDGLQPESSADRYLCYTDDLAIARHHADCMADWDTGVLETECDAIVFVIPIDRFIRSAFCLDRNFIRLAPSAGRATGSSLPKRRWNWYSLLKHAGAVGYRKSMKVDRADLILAPMKFLDVSDAGGIAVPPALVPLLAGFISANETRAAEGLPALHRLCPI